MADTCPNCALDHPWACVECGTPLGGSGEVPAGLTREREALQEIESMRVRPNSQEDAEALIRAIQSVARAALREGSGGKG